MSDVRVLDHADVDSGWAGTAIGVKVAADVGERLDA